MGDTAWKQHERKIARYFGVERNTRGADFGQVGCEVVAPLCAWRLAASTANTKRVGTNRIPMPRDEPYAGVIAECKQGYSHLPVTLFRDIANRNPDKDQFITLAKWGPFMMSWMEDRDKVRVFDTVWNELITKKMNVINFVNSYYMEWINRKVPKYLMEFEVQAADYGPAAEKQLGGRVLSLVALHAKGMQGRLIVWRF